MLVMGNIEVYERDGVYQIIATEIAPLGVGVMHVQLEQTKKKLENITALSAELLSFTVK